MHIVIIQGLVSREYNPLKLSVPTAPSSQFAFKSMEPVKIKLLKTVRSFSKDTLTPIAAFFSFVFQTAFGAQVAIKKEKMNLNSNKIDNSCCSADEILPSFQVLLAAVFTQKEKPEHLYKFFVALFVEE